VEEQRQREEAWTVWAFVSFRFGDKGEMGRRTKRECVKRYQEKKALQAREKKLRSRATLAAKNRKKVAKKEKVVRKLKEAVKAEVGRGRIARPTRKVPAGKAKAKTASKAAHARTKKAAPAKKKAKVAETQRVVVSQEPPEKKILGIASNPGRRRRKAAEGEKKYTGFSLAEDVGVLDPQKDYSGYFTKEKGRGGVIFEGFVVKPSEKGDGLYDVAVRYPDGSIHHKLHSAHVLREITQPFDKLLKRTVTRTMHGGGVAKGHIKKYLGTIHPEDPTVHTFLIGYPELETEEYLTNYKFGFDDTEETERYCELDPLEPTAAQKFDSYKHPYAKGERIEVDEKDQMCVDIFYCHEGKMKSVPVWVPRNGTVATLRHCIWQKSEWMDGWQPSAQTLLYGEHLLGREPSKPLKDFEIDDRDVISVQLIPLKELVKARDLENEYEKLHRMDVNIREMESLEDRPRKGKATGKSAGTSRMNDQYSRWKLDEVTKLVELIEEWYRYGKHRESGLWSGIKSAGGETFKRRKASDLRIKWRNLKNSAKLPPERRRGATAFPESLYDEVRRITKEWDSVKAKTGP